jgi:8-oxo-dGTP pyrophosphatase MutT (NUDIX family)
MTHPAPPPAGYPQGAVCDLVYWPERASVLLVKKLPHKFDGGRWGFPGGKQELFEPSASAARRELREECGGDATVGALAHHGVVAVVEDAIRSLEKHYLTLVHLFTVNRGAAPAAVNAEPWNHAAVAWFPLAALPPNHTLVFSIVMNTVRLGTSLAAVPREIAQAEWAFAAEDS